MNRDILFKAKQKDNGEWVEGCIITNRYANSGEIFEAYIVDYAYEQYGVLNYGVRPVLIAPLKECSFRVDINTICQYVGRTDSHGNTIFENDIVKTNSGRMCKVVWLSSPQHQGWDLIPLEYKNPPPSQYNLWSCLEVVGNIFDNPELLEQGV